MKLILNCFGYKYRKVSPQSNTEFHKVFSFFKWTAILMTSVL
jgi:hypothetical protein